MDKKMQRINELVKMLNIYRNEYYNLSRPSVTDAVYDHLYDELVALEKETNYVLNDSPTVSVGYEVKSSLETVTHDHPMLSLDKTKDIMKLLEFAEDKETLLMLKMDGLTMSLTYENGVLTKAETRGNGVKGLNVLHNALTVKNIPYSIRHKGRLVVDGEVIISNDDFIKINSDLPEELQYKNQRNLAAGSIMLLSNKETANRPLKFVAWKMIEGIEENCFSNQLDYLKLLGFTVVPYVKESLRTRTKEVWEENINLLQKKAEALGYPIDGLVLSFDDIAYGKSLGNTSHHVRSQLAFKFTDTVVESKLESIEWTMGMQGYLCPNAIFTPVEIDGTVVKRASLHNLSVMKKMNLTNNCTLYVYKANSIIPQIDSCLNDGDGLVPIPNTCPVCGSSTGVIVSDGTEELYCCNSNCPGTLLGKCKKFVGLDGTNIQGLSEAYLKKFIELKWIEKLSDIYALNEKKSVMLSLKGFGEKKVSNLLQSIEESKNIALQNFIVALCIPSIGATQGKKLAESCDSFAEFKRRVLDGYEWSNIDGIGESVDNIIKEWVSDENNRLLLNELGTILNISDHKLSNNTKSNTLSEMSFVITGELFSYRNREELQEEILRNGGKVSNGVAKKTTYLICNDASSQSSKIKKAKEIGITIITEEDFKKLIRY